MKEVDIPCFSGAKRTVRRSLRTSWNCSSERRVPPNPPLSLRWANSHARGGACSCTEMSGFCLRAGTGNTNGTSKSIASPVIALITGIRAQTVRRHKPYITHCAPSSIAMVNFVLVVFCINIFQSENYCYILILVLKKKKAGLIK